MSNDLSPGSNEDESIAESPKANRSGVPWFLICLVVLLVVPLGLAAELARAYMTIEQQASHISEFQYYEQLRGILDEIRETRASPSPDFDLIRSRATTIANEVVLVLKNKADRDHPAQQNLLWAARDELPKMMQDDLLTESKAEQNFAARLDDVARFLLER